MDDNELKECFKILQEQNDKLYESFGAIDEIIDLQISINRLRTKYNIADETKNTESNPGFVQ